MQYEITGPFAFEEPRDTQSRTLAILVRSVFYSPCILSFRRPAMLFPLLKVLKRIRIPP
jgi:hypothetical protein